MLNNTSWKQKRPRDAEEHAESHKKVKLEPWKSYGRENVPLDSQQDLDVFVLECDDASKDKTAITPSSFSKGEACIRIFGVTNNQQSVLVFIRGFHPYLYFGVTPAFTEKDAIKFSKLLKDELGEQIDIVGEITLIKDRRPLMCMYVMCDNYVGRLHYTVVVDDICLSLT